MFGGSFDQGFVQERGNIAAKLCQPFATGGRGIGGGLGGDGLSLRLGLNAA
jgi:hypothetical protein